MAEAGICVKSVGMGTIVVGILLQSAEMEFVAVGNLDGVLEKCATIQFLDKICTISAFVA